MAVADALRQGYLGWCCDAGHPEIVLSTTRGSAATSPTGRTWGFDAFRTIGRLLYQLQPVDGPARWLFTEQELQLDTLEMEEAIGLARDLVVLASGGRFRPQDAPNSETPVHVPPLRHPTRMERNDR